jgi:hypothetical protein
MGINTPQKNIRDLLTVGAALGLLLGIALGMCAGVKIARVEQARAVVRAECIEVTP